MRIKTLLFDTETSPMRGWFWGDNLYEQQILEVDKDWHFLGFSHRWAHEKKIHWTGQSDFPLFKKDPDSDYEVVKRMWELFNEADIIVAHNGRHFDIRKANTRFLVYGFPPPSRYFIMDTKEIAKRYFSFPSNKLDELSRQLDSQRKLPHTGKKLWFDCMEGKPAAWRKMRQYAIHDTRLLGDRYDQFLPWIHNHPDRKLYSPKTGCPICHKNDVHKRGKRLYVREGWRRMYFCNYCLKHVPGELLEALK